MAKVRININLESELLDKIDNFAKQMSVTRTGAISVLINQSFEYKNAIEMLPQMMGAISDLKQLEDEV
jgi:metal-responsive CopG/Arc/MetJ family transcriptional regulator